MTSSPDQEPLRAEPAEGDMLQLHAAAAKFEAGEFAAAVDLLRRALDFRPDAPVVLNNLAIALWRAGRTEEAEVECRRAIALAPDLIDAHRLFAEICRSRRDAAGALACYRRIAELAPNWSMPHNNAGILLKDIGRFEEAAASFARAEALNPTDLKTRFNRLMLRRDEAALSEAIACCRQLLEQEPDNSDILTDLAAALTRAGDYDEALVYFNRAVTLNPSSTYARVNRALVLLLRGEFEIGWRDYEARWHLFQIRRPDYTQPEWNGENLDGRTILLQQEQGFGDVIQFLRYAPMVAARGGRVVLRADRQLLRLAFGVLGIFSASPPDRPLPEFDVWCPLLSLPRIFGTRAHTIPGAVPYLWPRPTIIERWRRCLAQLPGLRVGLAWARSAVHPNDFRRSIAFARLAPLFLVPGISWVGLQKGKFASDLATLPPGAVTDLSSGLRDLAETAGAIVNLDLVISVDTAVAHLAGALAKPTWTLLPFSPDWRWQLGREDNPWYPTMRLFRQRRAGDWEEVIARVVTALRAISS